MPEKIVIGHRIKRMRKAQGLTQKQLAEKTGVSRSLIGQIETHKVKPTLEFLYKFVRLCNSSYEAIIEGTTDDAPVQYLEEPQPPYGASARENELLRQMLQSKEETISALQGENKSLKKLIHVLENKLERKG